MSGGIALTGQDSVAPHYKDEPVITTLGREAFETLAWTLNCSYIAIEQSEVYFEIAKELGYNMIFMESSYFYCKENGAAIGNVL